MNDNTKANCTRKSGCFFIGDACTERGRCEFEATVPKAAPQDEATEPTVPAGWQSIETAPKDGTEMILSNGETVTLGWWMEHEGGTTEYRDADGHYLGQRDDDGYIGWWDVAGGMQPEPTHWQALPAAPQTPKKAP